MKRLLLGLSLVIGVWILSPTPQAEAYGWSHGSHYRGHYNRGHYSRGHHSWWSHHSVHKGGFAAPELDLGAAGGAMVLLLGGVAYIASRRREESLT